MEESKLHQLVETFVPLSFTLINFRFVLTSLVHRQGMLNEPGEGGGGGRGGGGSMDSDGLRSPRNSFVLGSADGGALKQHSNHPHYHQRHHHAAFATKSPEPEIGRRYEEEDFEDKDEYYDDLNNSHYELTEAAQARDTATEATLWKHKVLILSAQNVPHFASAFFY